MKNTLWILYDVWTMLMEVPRKLIFSISVLQIIKFTIVLFVKCDKENTQTVQMNQFGSNTLNNE